MNSKILTISVTVIAALLVGYFSYTGSNSNSDSKLPLSAVPNVNGDVQTPEKGNVAASEASLQLTSDEVRNIVKDYIDANPEAIMQSIEKYYNAKATDAKMAQKEKVQQLHDQVYNSVNDPKLGKADGAMKIVQFSDYSCQFCKRVSAVHQRVLAEYSDLQIIVKEMPIMGDWSIFAGRAAIAVNMLDSSKYASFHEALLQLQERSEASVMQAATALGIDAAKLQEAMQKAEVDGVIQSNLKLAADLKIRGTPAYIIGNEIIPGAIEYNELKLALDAFQPAVPAATSTAPVIEAPTVPALEDTSTAGTATGSSI